MEVNRKKIASLRRKLNLSMREAALACGWKTAQQWASVENGTRKNPGVLTMAAVAMVLRCKIDDLVTGIRDTTARKSKGRGRAQAG